MINEYILGYFLHLETLYVKQLYHGHHTWAFQEPGKRVMGDKDTRACVHFQNEQSLFFLIAVYMLFNSYLEIASRV